MRLSLSWGVGEIAMNDRPRSRQAGEGHRADNDGNQHQKRHLLHSPERWDVVCIEQLLRGKIPGNPG
jgi:hypothetical protein